MDEGRALRDEVSLSERRSMLAVIIEKIIDGEFEASGESMDCTRLFASRLNFVSSRRGSTSDGGLLGKIEIGRRCSSSSKGAAGSLK